MAAQLTFPCSTPATAALQLPSQFKGSVRQLWPGYFSAFPSSAALGLRLVQRRPVVPFRASAAISAPVASSSSPAGRFRLNNLAPQPGSRKKGKRKGRGYAAGQGGSCGFGMRGQKSRSGPGVRKGFEGGQMPLYRRIPKLRGIAGGNSLISLLPGVNCQKRCGLQVDV
ncbi:hypothetical protein Taro_019288 [Colocasia esculenta]|uniref:Ribosomal protein L18e/L15P domain-containing protein n=1 Tax=Colocasia esculenta TaxID=4460 RepID=A0A843V1Q1_COLES|nr:hypothetical protein [Colocasia esculenta]